MKFLAFGLVMFFAPVACAFTDNMNGHHEVEQEISFPESGMYAKLLPDGQYVLQWELKDQHEFRLQIAKAHEDGTFDWRFPIFEKRIFGDNYATSDFPVGSYSWRILRVRGESSFWDDGPNFGIFN